MRRASCNSIGIENSNFARSAGVMHIRREKRNCMLADVHPLAEPVPQQPLPLARDSVYAPCAHSQSAIALLATDAGGHCVASIAN
jgi:hypothetical protein